MKCRALIFDLDGTLVDSMSHFADVASKVISKHFGVDKIKSRAMYRQTSGLPFALQLEALFPQNPKNQNAEAEYESEKLIVSTKTRLFSDVLPALKKLKNSGLRLIVSSNNQKQNVIDKLKSCADVFDDVLGFEPPDFLKGPKHLEAVKKKFGLSNQQIIFVGDSLHDGRMAAENGVFFKARLGTFEKEDFDDIPNLGMYREFEELARQVMLLNQVAP